MSRKLSVLVLLVLAMTAVHELQGTVADGAIADALTLAAIGFVILAAQQLAEIAASVGLPSVTGYILAGIAAGPQAAALLHSGHVADMKVFNDLALALIALEAGLELKIDSIKRVARTLGSIILFKVPLSWLLVGGAFVLASPLLPGSESLDTPTLIAIALVLGALAVGTSPAVSVAVIAESGAKGKTPDLILAIAVAKDVVMIIMLAVAMAVATVLTTEGASFTADVLTELGLKIGLSIGAGVLVGLGLIAWMRWVRWELVLLLILLGYGLSAASETLHLKALLVFIAAGFTVANFSRYGHDLHKPLALLALPVFVVFFTTVGAGLDLSSAVAVLPVAGILFVARLAMLYSSTRLGCAIAGDSRRFADNVWQGFISQAGVALGLLLIAQKTVPAIAEPVGQVASVLIALNLLIGPVLLRRSLGFEADAPATAGAPEPESDDARPAPDVEVVMPGGAGPNDETLVELGREIQGHVQRLLSTAETELLDRWQAAAAARGAGPRQAAALAHGARAVEDAVQTLRRELAALPTEVRVAREDHHLEALPDMSWLDRLRLRLWLRGGAKGWVRVPVRRAARTILEGDLIPALDALLADVARAEMADLCRASTDAGPAAEVAQRCRRELRLRGRDSLARVAHALRHGGSPGLPARRLAYREVARDVDRAVRRLADDGRTWDPALEAVAGRAALAETLLGLGAELRGQTAEALSAWRDTIDEQIIGRVRDAEAALDRAAHEASGDGTVLHHLGVVDQMLRGEILPALAALQTAEQPTSHPLRAIGEHVQAVVDAAPADVRAAVGALDIPKVERPSDLRVVQVDARAAAVQYLSGELVWLDDAREDADRMLDLASQRLGEVSGVTGYGLSLASTEGAEGMALARDSITRARRAVTDLAGQLESQEALIIEQVTGSIDDALIHLVQHALGDRRLTTAGALMPTSVAAATGRVGRRALAAVGEALARTLRIAARMKASRRAREARIARGEERLDPAMMAQDVLALGVDPEQWLRVPRVLARLFDASTLDVADALVGSETQIEAVEAAWTRFRGGEPTSVLLVGAEGSGKTSVARVTLRRVVGRRLVTVGLDASARTESGLSSTIGAALGVFDVRRFSDIERALAGERRIVLLDGLEHAFVRTSGGLAHIRGLLQLIAATRDSICWVISVADPTARLLDRLCELRSWFTDHVDFPPLSAETLASIIETRCRLSGFKARYPNPRLSFADPVARFVRRLRGGGGGRP